MKIGKILLMSLIVYFVLALTASAATNLLTNPGFEAGSPIATGWEDEHTTHDAATYSISTTQGVVDGSKSQKIDFQGQALDDGTQKFEIFQAPIYGMQAGDVLNFTVSINGSFSGTYGILGIESFTAAHTYISETDKTITSLTGSPTRYNVSYTCPANTNYVAVYLQFAEIYPSSTVSIELDGASLVNSNNNSNNSVGSSNVVTYQTSNVLSTNSTYVPSQLASLTTNISSNYTGDPYSKVNMSGLVGWYKFDEGAGTSVSDSSGNHRDSTSTSGLSWGTLKYNSCGSFAGTSNSVTLPNTLGINSTMGFSAWINTSDNSTAKSQQILMSQTSGTVSRNYQIYLNGATPTFKIGMGADTSTLSYNYNICNNTTYFIAYSIASNKQCTCWIFNGSTWYSDTQTFDYNLINTSTSPFMIGYLSGDTTAWKGKIDDVKIYNRTLPQAEVYTLCYDDATNLTANTNSNSTQSGNIIDRGLAVNIPYSSLDSNISSITYTAPNSISLNGIMVYGYPKCVSPFTATITASLIQPTSPSHSNAVISWSGFNWNVKNGTSLSPGPNNYSNSSDNVWVDDQDRLHLTIKNDGGKWNCTDIECQDDFTFGKFTWKIDSSSQIFNMSQPAAWLGLFTYRDDNNENDVEISRWQGQGNHLVLYTVQPYGIPGNSIGYLPATTTNGNTATAAGYNGMGATVSINRQPNYIDFETLDDNNNVIASEHFTNVSAIDQGPEKLMTNLYLRDIPAGGSDVECIIDSVTYQAANDVTTNPVTYGNTKTDNGNSAASTFALIQVLVFVIGACLILNGLMKGTLSTKVITFYVLAVIIVTLTLQIGSIACSLIP